MVKPPAVIVIARHGARLDAENRSWIETSTAAYDPPLSYGGWTQTRALGARIASLLHARNMAMSENDAAERRRASDAINAKASVETHSREGRNTSKRRKHKIVIHSSPFLRCVQSSIAIGAGISQYEGNLALFESQQPDETAKSAGLFNTPVRSKTLDTTALESKYGHTHRLVHSSRPRSTVKVDCKSAPRKPMLRIDACLGEWLSPDYYELITPPPPSKMMVAGAKAALLLASTPIHGSHMPGEAISDNADSGSGHSDDSPFSMSQLTETLEEEEDENFPTRITSGQKRAQYSPSQPHHTTTPGFGYQPPTPTYAISTSDAIPEGYVAHARDACVKVDLQWDSMQDLQNCGDGGEYGEEWSSMHNRFRKGLMGMITWYKKHDPFDSIERRPRPTTSSENLESEDDGDLVLVIVTHGAGCNALIGALTNQPVLLDVGMGSLTMAVRRDTTASSYSGSTNRSPSFPPQRRSSVDISQSEDYEMKLIASTDHLKAGADPLKIPQLQPSNMMPSIPENSRPRGKTVSSSTGAISTHDGLDRPRSRNSALGSIRRIRPTATTAFHRDRNQDEVVSPGGSTGLWTGSGRRASTQDEADPLANPGVLRAGSASPGIVQTPPTGEGPTRADSPMDQAYLGRRGSQRGLWGGGTVPEGEPARRWTLQGSS